MCQRHAVTLILDVFDTCFKHVTNYHYIYLRPSLLEAMSLLNLRETAIECVQKKETSTVSLAHDLPVWTKNLCLTRHLNFPSWKLWRSIISSRNTEQRTFEIQEDQYRDLWDQTNCYRDIFVEGRGDRCRQRTKECLQLVNAKELFVSFAKLLFDEYPKLEV